MKWIACISLNIISFIGFAQKDQLHTYTRASNDTYTIAFKSMEDGKGIIFSIDNYSETNPINVATYLTKVDYCGDIDVTSKVEIDGYTRIMLFDGVKHNDSYTFVGTAVQIFDGQSYIITLSSDLELLNFDFLDKMLINYPFFSSYQVSSNYDSHYDQHYVAINISNNFDSSLESFFLSYNAFGQIKQVKNLELGRDYISDYFYNSDTKKHYIMSDTYLTILNQDLEILGQHKIYVELSDVKWFNFDYRILHADDFKAVLVGRWGSRRELYVYTIYFHENKFEPGEYYLSTFPNLKFYFLSKQISKENKIIVSATSDELETSNSTPNVNYFWEFDKNGNILKSYKFEDNLKKNLRITNIDSKGNMLGIGYEYVPDRNFFVILSQASSFLVGNTEIPTENNSILIYPNPTSENIIIPNLSIGDKVLFYNMLGQLVFDTFIYSNEVKILDISHLPIGQYYTVIKNGKASSQHGKFIKI